MDAVIVTGGNGFLGKHLITALLAKEYYVYNVVRHSLGIMEHENYSELVCDSYEMLCIKSCEIVHPIKNIYHLAWAGTSGKKRMDIDLQISNISFSYKMIEFAKENNINQIVYAGSIMEYECLKNVFHNNKYYGGAIYSAAKLSGHLFSEFSAKINNIQYIPIIISNIYGVGENSPRFINNLVRKMCTEYSIDLTEGNQLQDFIYVSDAVEMIIQIAEKGESFKQYYIGNQNQYPLKDFVYRAASVLGYIGKLNFGAVPYQDIPLDYKEFNVHSFYEDFSFRPKIGFEEGIEKLYKEAEEHHESSNFGRWLRN